MVEQRQMVEDMEQRLGWVGMVQTDRHRWDTEPQEGMEMAGKEMLDTEEGDL